MSVEACWLTHQTGTIIRFRPSQLSRLPNDDMDLTVELFDGQVIPGRFHLHPSNPYVAGPRIVQFIRSHVRPQSREQALISVVGRHWRLFKAQPVSKEMARYGVSRQRAALGQLRGKDIDRILKKIDRLSDQSSRRKEYQRLTRPPGLRQIIIELMGMKCQVEGCDAAQSTADEWDDDSAALSVLEVHHIEAVAKIEDHSPRNLCVLCANHHRLIHGFGPWAICHRDDDVILTREGRHLYIVRDLSVLS